MNPNNKILSIGQLCKNDVVVYLICFTKSCSKCPYVFKHMPRADTTHHHQRVWCGHTPEVSAQLVARQLHPSLLNIRKRQ